ncbi:MAG: homogentisate 1,2-dioxygenase [Phenylobacterium sp.]|jgi:hypothetical protein|uniref:homogentisate 1,2-dioxygenase n=1 Tax=Phenylobacterium sp. TaxID=1871053 RepID=UPI002A290551|nr:homogentisate 1,2-dioxygenase [Phenylobacterium sp.]MDD3837729.1 homogentisate 1,2-dioxygenase [Phenylobacterium sp.]MDX9998625.1 homogentisate 1,2-dioxygenase [Phenylobacterium sp.]
MSSNAIKIAIALLPALTLAAGSALAQAPPHQACASISDEGLPATLAGWTSRSPLAAAADLAGVGAAQLPIGRAVTATLKPTRDVVFPVLPAQPGGSVSQSGLFELLVAQPGDYQISLGAGGWIDVLSGGERIQSVRHGRGPACSTVRKTVTFPLKPGRYVVAITGAAQPALPVMVTRVAP